MLRRIGWTLPLLLGALACLAGCTFPKSFGFARKQQPEPQAQVAEERATAAPSDTEAKPRPTSLVQVLRKPADWFPLKRRKPESADQQALADHANSAPAASQPLSYPDVVPSKYRNMDAGVPDTSLAKDASGTPSLVRPSRRPPPDPAPKPPLEERRDALLVERPRAEDPLYDIIAAATRSWRVDESAHTVGTAGNAVAQRPASDPALPRQLATETQLKFTPPDLSAREQKQVRKPLDIATNILRPAKSAPKPADQSAPPGAPSTHTTPPADPNTHAAPGTTWIAKKASPSSTTPSVSTPAAAVASAGPANSTVVANTFGSTTGKPDMGHSAAPAQGPAPRSEPSPAPKPVNPLVTIPDRTEAVARAEAARAEALSNSRPPYWTKTPSHARPSVPTRAAAPPAAIAQEMLAPLVDATTYRAQLASTPRGAATPVHTAARESSSPTPGSWVAAYERLVQRPDARPAPRAPTGSPTRSLRSDDEPALPEPEAPTLRR